MPMRSSTQPERKASSTANSAPSPCRFSLVRMAAIAVGPMAESFTDPNAVYTKHAMKDEYSPYCGGSPATPAYAIAWGITVSPTVIPGNYNRVLTSLLYCPEGMR
jgi:hypothetical protein